MKKIFTLCVILIICMGMCSCNTESASDVDIEAIFTELCTYYDISSIEPPLVESVDKIDEAYAYGYFNREKNSIEILNYNISIDLMNNILGHEILHYISYNNNPGKTVNGLSYHYCGKIFGGFLDEGVTQYFTNKVYPSQIGPNGEEAYPIEALFAEQLAYMFGEETLFDCYISSNPLKLRELYNSEAYEAGFEDYIADDIGYLTPFDELCQLIDISSYVSMGYNAIPPIGWDIPEGKLLRVASQMSDEIFEKVSNMLQEHLSRKGIYVEIDI